MASTQAAKSDVVHVAHPDGSHSIGVKVGKVFVPFQTIDAVTFADRVEALQSPEHIQATGAPAEEDES